MGAYLGSINKAEFAELPYEEQVELLISQGACEEFNSCVATINKNELFVDLSGGKNVLKPSEKLINDFSKFILREYEHEITVAYVSYFNQFEDDLYGLSIGDQKKEGLVRFNEIYKTVDFSQINFIKRDEKIGLVENIKKIGRLEKLNYIRRAKMSNLCELPMAVEYLFGNRAYFASTTFKYLDAFKEVIDFESNLKILVNLNERFQFEDDFIFGERAVLKEKFEANRHIFNSFDVFEYSYNKIESFETAHPTNIGSLYHVLKDLDLIIGKKSFFIKYVAHVHNIDLSSIKYFEVGKNKEHDFRVKNIKKELLKYSEEK